MYCRFFRNGLVEAYLKRKNRSAAILSRDTYPSLDDVGDGADLGCRSETDFSCLCELHLAVFHCVESMVFANLHVFPGDDDRTALTNDDVADLRILAVVNFRAEILRL